jgi:hypothetical protein
MNILKRPTRGSRLIARLTDKSVQGKLMKKNPTQQATLQPPNQLSSSMSVEIPIKGKLMTKPSALLARLLAFSSGSLIVTPGMTATTTALA